MPTLQEVRQEKALRQAVEGKEPRRPESAKIETRDQREKGDR